MPNKLDILFAQKKSGILNIFCTAGYPGLDSTTEVILALQSHGADIIEIGMPYSDPIADGPVIQQANTKALQNGINMALLFSQLDSIRLQLTIPVILMGYLNPVLQFGMDRFCESAAATGVSGVILPDMPLYEYEKHYRHIFEKHRLYVIFLITPQTSRERIKKADELSRGFLYAVSSSGTTGNNRSFISQEKYFSRLKNTPFKNPLLIGFGVKDRETFRIACAAASGAIIGSAYLKELENTDDIGKSTRQFIQSIQ